MEKVKAHKKSADSPPMRHYDGASINNYQVIPRATSSGVARGNHEYVVQGEGTHPSNRMPSDDDLQPLMTREEMERLFKNLQQQPAHYKPPVDISEQQRIEEERQRKTEDELSKSEQETDKALQELARSRARRPPPSFAPPDSIPDDTPHMSKEEMSRLFKWQDQQDDSGQVTVKQTPQQVEDSLVKERRRQELIQKAEQALLEVNQVRKQPPRKTILPHTSSKQEPVNQRQPKKKINQQQVAADDSDSDIEENVILKGIDDEIHEMAEEVRRMSRRPSADEVLFDDEDSSLPYDPNLICPKCGRQYRVGGIQKFKRHMVEFCTGKR